MTADNFIIQDYLKKDLPYHPTWGGEVVYYYSPQVTFREIPDEISLTIPTLCYNHCSKDCNSKFCWIENWKEKREELTENAFVNLLKENSGITCVTFMTSTNFYQLRSYLWYIKSNYPNIKTALYIGQNLDYLLKYRDFCELNFENIDYIKVGAFDKIFGPLNNPNTNQRFYKINHLGNNKDEFCCINKKFLEKPL